MPEPKGIKVQMELERTTKGAVRYAEVTEDESYAIGTLYLRKTSLPVPPPETITVAIIFAA